ncbi:MAG: Cys-tRNA(Pro) deacylase [archaeon]|nr:Cys-tRNA(Pro) deacylase [archaeon]
MEKTNPMRILDRAKIQYVVHDYTDTGMVAGMDVAQVLGENPAEVFKTLVTQGKSDRYYVFVVPVTSELDLKKAAASVGEKSVVMIPSKELQATTGYIHGGCSPLGMRKQLRTVIDASARDHVRFYMSGGKVGIQIELDFADLSKVLDFQLVDIVR